LSPVGGGRGWKCLAGAIIRHAPDKLLIAPKYFSAIEKRLNQLKKGVNIEIFAITFILDER